VVGRANKKDNEGNEMWRVKGCTKGADNKVDFVALLACTYVASKGRKGMGSSNGSLRCYDLHNVLLALTDPQP
jgi:hypothetical protein